MSINQILFCQWNTCGDFLSFASSLTKPKIFIICHFIESLLTPATCTCFSLSRRTKYGHFLVASAQPLRVWSRAGAWWVLLNGAERECVFNLWWIQRYVLSCCPGLFFLISLCCWAGICYVWSKKWQGIPGWVPKLMENTNEIKSGNQSFCFGWRGSVCFWGLR